MERNKSSAQLCHVTIPQAALAVGLESQVLLRFFPEEGVTAGWGCRQPNTREPSKKRGKWVCIYIHFRCVKEGNHDQGVTHPPSLLRSEGITADSATSPNNQACHSGGAKSISQSECRPCGEGPVGRLPCVVCTAQQTQAAWG